MPTSADGSLYTVKEFRGAFFGPSAPEVDGVFDVLTSEDNKNGAFHGAFDVRT